MSIGNNIYKLRASKNLSQGDLADMLDVSRQSVSKWETDTAVPDLDKLIKLCDVFEVTLDDLTGRKEIKAQPINLPEADKKTSFSVQKIIGYILFTLSLLFGLFIILFGTNKYDFIILPPIAIALLVCGLLCLFAGNKAFYWCIWTALAPITVLTPHFIRLTMLSKFNIAQIGIFVIMIFVANTVFKDVVIKTGKGRSVLLILGWILSTALYVAHSFLVTIDIDGSPATAYSGEFSFILNLVSYVLIAGLETYTVCYIKNCKKEGVRI